MLDHLSSVPSIKGGNVRNGGKDTSDKETEEHQSTGSGIKSVALLEDDRVGDEEEVQAVGKERISLVPRNDWNPGCLLTIHKQTTCKP